MHDPSSTPLRRGGVRPAPLTRPYGVSFCNPIVATAVVVAAIIFSIAACGGGAGETDAAFEPQASALLMVALTAQSNDTHLLAVEAAEDEAVDSARFPGKPVQLDFVDTRHGWLATSEGLWRTTDGGASWEERTNSLPVPVDPGNDKKLKLVGVSFATAEHGVVFGRHDDDRRSPLLGFTRDGGDTWNHAEYNFVRRPEGVRERVPFYETRLPFHRGCLTPDGTGLVSAEIADGGFPPVVSAISIRTTDSGASWHQLYPGGRASQAFCGGPSVIWEAGQLPREGPPFLSYSDDGGLTPETRELPPGQARIECAVGPDSAWAVGNGSILRSTDKGESWHRLEVPLKEEYPSRARFRSAALGLVVLTELAPPYPERALMTRDGGSSWAEVVLPFDVASIEDLVMLR